jgi:EpsI family protein
VHATLLVAFLAVFPLYEGHLAERPVPVRILTLPTPAAGWQAGAENFSDWLPQWNGMDVERIAHYTRGDQRVMLYLAWYGTQRDHAELINSRNIMIQERHPEWRQVGRGFPSINLGTGPVPVYEAKLAHGDGSLRILAWQWHRIKGQDGTDPYTAKLELALAKLMGRQDIGAAIVVATPYHDEAELPQTQAVLTDFVTAHKAVLDRMLDQADKQ